MTSPRTTNTQIYHELQEIKQLLAERRHYDVTVEKHIELLDGNGRPGFKIIRDKVMQWDNKINAVIVVVLGDIAVRIFQYVVR